MTKNIFNYAFKSRKTTISKLMNDSHEFGISKNLFYYENPQMEIYSIHQNVSKVLGSKWNKSLNAKESLGLQKNFVYYIGSRNMRKFITACDLPEENVCKYSGQNNLQLLKTKLFLCKHQPNCRFLFLKSVEYKKNLRQSLMNCNVKSWVCEKLLSKQIQSGKGSSKEEEEEEKNWGGPEAYSLIIFMKDDFDEIINQNPSILVFFSARWCQYCRNLRIPFGKAAVMAKEANLPVVFATFDVTTNPDIADEKGIIGVPVIKYYKNGKFISDFKGKRTFEALFDFVKSFPENEKN